MTLLGSGLLNSYYSQHHYLILYHIGSVAFNEEGRYHENGDWRKMMYGAFSGPQ